jgi:hypothetical protein
VALPASDGLPRVAGELVFVSAPTSRCGTTLVQRLLSSAPELFVFGEGVAAGLLELVQGLARRVPLLARAGEQRRDLERALAGEQFWCPHLTADVPGYVALFRQALERFLTFHATEARRHGRARFGAKLPTVPLEDLVLLRRVVPGTRVVYVVRALAEAARSAKARRFLTRPADFVEFARLWRAGTDGLATLAADPRVFVLEHERLQRRDPELLAELAAFTGVRALDSCVLATRVNTWSGAGEGHAPDELVAPAELTDEELHLLGLEPGARASA